MSLPMSHHTFSDRRILRLGAALFVAFAFPFVPAGGAAPQKKTNVEQELVHTETGFFEAWKTKDLAYFRDHIPENGLFWGESGTLSRDQQLQEQQALEKNCAVEGYGLSDFQVLQLATGAYLLTYNVQQYASCGGEKMPVHMNGSSVYIFKGGRWQAIYRAEVPLQNQP
ncbi:MAG: nuclear transport factor 2 family protein [Candidatus Sulfotelmatobacter sp.]